MFACVKFVTYVWDTGLAMGTGHGSHVRRTISDRSRPGHHPHAVVGLRIWNGPLILKRFTTFFFLRKLGLFLETLEEVVGF